MNLNEVLFFALTFKSLTSAFIVLILTVQVGAQLTSAYETPMAAYIVFNCQKL